jgi:hypothetical protein
MKNIAVVILMFLCVQVFSQQKKFNLNDPRHPDCPCHKIQKLAEKEFSKNNSSGLSEKKKRKRSNSLMRNYIADAGFKFQRKLHARKFYIQDVALCYKW